MTVRQVYNRYKLFCPCTLKEEDVEKICRAFDSELKVLFEDSIPKSWNDTVDSLLVPFPYDDIYVKLLCSKESLYSYEKSKYSLYRHLELIAKKRKDDNDDKSGR